MAKYFTVNNQISDVQPDNGCTFTLKELQKSVDGFIELVYLRTPDGKLQYIMVIDDNGKNEKPVNYYATQLFRVFNNTTDWIAGDALLCNPSELEP